MLHLDYKANITQNCQKIELYGSPTSKEFKKPHSSWRVGEAETWKGVERHGDVEQAIPHPCVVDKNREWGIPAPHQTTLPRVPASGRWAPITSGRKNPWCGWGGRRNCRILRCLPWKGPQWTWDLHRLTSSGLQHQGNSWKDTSGIRGEMEVSSIRASARGHLPPGQNSRGQAVAWFPIGALPHMEP